MSSDDNRRTNGDYRGGDQDYSSQSSRRRYGGSPEYGRNYSSNYSSGERRYEEPYQGGDRRGSGRGYFGGNHREDSYSKSGSRDEDYSRGYARQSSPGEHSSRPSYSSSSESSHYSSYRSSSSYNSPYDRDGTSASNDRFRSSYGSQDRKYDRSYYPSQSRSEDSSQKPSYSAGDQSAGYPPRGGQYSSSSSSIRPSEPSFRTQDTAVPAEMYMPSPMPSQHDNLRSSDARDLSHSSSSYRPSGSSTSQQSSTQSTGRQHDLQDSQSFSISRAPTQPLEGYSSLGSSNHPSSLNLSSSSTFSSLPNGPTDTLNSTLVSFWKSLLTGLDGLDPDEQAAFKTAVDSSITHLQGAHNSASEAAKASAHTLANLESRTAAEIAHHKAQREFILSNYAKRMVDGDFNECIRVIQGLEAPNGEWPEPAWSLPPFHGIDGGIQSTFETSMDAQLPEAGNV